jgi:hypothetical protein
MSFDFMQASSFGRTIPNIPPERSAAKFSTVPACQNGFLKTLWIKLEDQPTRFQPAQGVWVEIEHGQSNPNVRLKESNHAKPTPTTTA